MSQRHRKGQGPKQKLNNQTFQTFLGHLEQDLNNLAFSIRVTGEFLISKGFCTAEEITAFVQARLTALQSPPVPAPSSPEASAPTTLEPTEAACSEKTDAATTSSGKTLGSQDESVQPS